jgi:hypothetical protein
MTDIDYRMIQKLVGNKKGRDDRSLSNLAPRDGFEPTT